MTCPGPLKSVLELRGFFLFIAVFLPLLLGGCGAGDSTTNPFRALSTGNPEARKNAAAAMGELDTSGDALRAIPELSAALTGDDDGQVRAASARSLGLLARRHGLNSDTMLLDALTAGMNDSEPEVRHASAVALAGIGAEPEGLAPALFAALKSENMMIRDDADIALSSLPLADLAHLKALLEGVDDDDTVVRRASRMALMQAALAIDPDEAAETVAGAINGVEDVESRALLATMLGRFPPETSPSRGQLILTLADDPEAEVRVAAAGSLQRFAAVDPEAAEALRQATIEDDATEVRVAAASALAAPDRPRQEALESLIDAIETSLDDASARAELVAALGSESDEGGDPTGLIERLASEDPTIRAFAARGLGVIAPRTREAGSAIEALIPLLNDPEAEVRVASADALSRFGPAARSAASALASVVENDSDRRVAAHAAAAMPVVDPPPTR